jgi:hypothetical protein
MSIFVKNSPMKVSLYENVRVKKDDVEVFIPDEPFYCFETGIRRAIRIIPEKVDWESPFNKKGDVFRLHITCVYQSYEVKVERFSIDIFSVENILNGKPTYGDHNSIIHMLHHRTYEPRTKERFEDDLIGVINKITLDDYKHKCL